MREVDNTLPHLSGLYRSCLPARARSSVFWSAYSRSPPTGSPRARRVTRTPNGANCWRRYSAVASPSMLGLVARITSWTAPASHPLDQRADLQIFRADALDRRKHAVQHVVTPAEPAGAFQHQHVQRLLNHAQHGIVAARIGADLAALLPAGVMLKQIGQSAVALLNASSASASWRESSSGWRSK